jgi:cytochrome c biogenesis protein CcmG, thiol:disulfide interchange protein DsbE
MFASCLESTSRLGRLALLVATLATAVAAHAVEVGQPAPSVKLSGLKDTVDLAALRGRVVYLDFWASWCGPCRVSFPWMNEMQAKYGARGLQIVGVSVDAQRDDADKFLAQVPARFQIAFDPVGDTPKRYAIKGMPTAVLIGADGQVLHRHSGFRESDQQALEAAIVAALKQAGR